MQAGSNIEKSINWGGVMKGIAVVAAVAVAAVVVMYVAPMAINALSSAAVGTGFEPWIKGALDGASWLWDKAVFAANEVAILAGKGVDALASTLGIAGKTLNPGTTSAIAENAGKILGVATIAAAIPAAAKALNNTDFVTARPVPSPAAQGPQWAERELNRRRVSTAAPAAPASSPTTHSGGGHASTVASRGASHANAEALRAATADLNKAL